MNKINDPEIVQELISALEGWEDLFLKQGESEIVEENIEIPDYRFVFSIKRQLKVSRKILDKIKWI